MAVQPDHEIVLAGVASENDPFNPDLALARYNPDGTLDPNFGTGGKLTTDVAPLTHFFLAQAGRASWSPIFLCRGPNSMA